MIMEDFVTFEQAKALKELGFDWKCNHYYNVITKEFRENYNYYSPEDAFENPSSYDNHNNDPHCVSVPTLAQAQKWLREEKQIYLFIDMGVNSNRQYYWYITDSEGNSRKVSFSPFDSFEEALTSGIDKAIEILTQEK